MKRILTVALSALMAVLLATTALAATAAGPTVTVSATAKISVEPDIAYVSLGVRTEHASPKTVKQQNTATMTKVLAALKKAGVDEKDIQTSNLSMYTNYTWDNNGNRKISGYTVNNTVSITVRDLDKVGDIVDAAMNAGANQFNSVSFAIEDEEEYYIQVLAEATKKAQKRASAIAKASGMTLGTPVSLSSTGASYDPYRYYADAVEAEMATADEEASIGSTITSGQVTVTATINAVYNMK
ncbi:MAG: SIMPL domain-containing protein [Christensenellales bacterium]|jgi:uncharacterized protein YggE